MAADKTAAPVDVQAVTRTAALVTGQAMWAMALLMASYKTLTPEGCAMIVLVAKAAGSVRTPVAKAVASENAMVKAVVPVVTEAASAV